MVLPLSISIIPSKLSHKIIRNVWNVLVEAENEDEATKKILWQRGEKGAGNVKIDAITKWNQRK